MTDTNTWLTDANGNKCSVEWFGSIEAAQKALDSLENCENCINCSRCSGCSDCSRCSGCSRCSDCSNLAKTYSKKDICAVPPAEGEEATPLGAPPVPIIENINQRILEAVSKPKALDMGNWHTCGSTHCRGGWAVHLAGEAGYALERFHNTALAAQLIYKASGWPISPVRFFETNEQAMADMKRLADEEAAKAAV